MLRSLLQSIAATQQQALEVQAGIGPGRWSAADVLLITYGHSVTQAGLSPLASLRAFWEQRLAPLVSAVHVLPFFPSTSDDGFSVVDFRAVDPELGAWEDLTGLARRAQLMVDLVLNHVSRESLWFIDFVAGRDPGQLIRIPAPWCAPEPRPCWCPSTPIEGCAMSGPPLAKTRLI
ncbi:MAG: hypothetical protein EBU29_00050 [Gammaproteobacteria bacterium]|nr:hypothetical protein [Gammaproteobacteria bacterium]